MKNIKITLFFINIVVVSACGQDVPTINKYNIFDTDNVSNNNYVLDFYADNLFYIKNNKLFKMNMISNLKDSISLGLNMDEFTNLIARSDGISILSFDKGTQYDINMEKEIRLINLDLTMNILDTALFKSTRESHLLDEDFIFTSVFIDKNKNKYFFNDQFSRLLIVEENKWSFDYYQRTFIDPITGYIYEISNDRIEEKTSIKSPSIKKFDTSTPLFIPTQFSVIKNMLIYNIQDKLRCYDGTSSAKWKEYKNCGFNPCRRFENGIYRLRDGILYIMHTF